MPPKYSRELREPVAQGPRLKEQFRTSPCEGACPAGTSIQKMQALAEKGDFTEGLHLLDGVPGGAGALTGRSAELFLQARAVGDGLAQFSAVLGRHL